MGHTALHVTIHEELEVGVGEDYNWEANWEMVGWGGIKDVVRVIIAR